MIQARLVFRLKDREHGTLEKVGKVSNHRTLTVFIGLLTLGCLPGGR